VLGHTSSPSPTQAGNIPILRQYARNAWRKLEREIAGLKANLIECPDTNTAVTLNAMRQHQIKQFEAELSRLRNEQPCDKTDEWDREHASVLLFRMEL
jgi:hypothetical protein